ncbi:Co2+/Mg2+ efflux protein ApaG [Taibaiella soli]|uniref:Protein ApaG n=1 Tax=Taibaiella soli TaxID=1649169 RepID=A0A2W2AY40_9BACT|nr:Co2+/Mg2+ efflux protein ApaG [Taibaiella soli]PZF72954.1 Co2+/Mg2+ efflux protein ApaG [Taibaiella soli]
MVKQITEGVSITVETFYQPNQSNPLNGEYLFAYRITIENLSTVPVKLLRRHWHIVDSNGLFREVEGEGVVGQQPIIQPGEDYQYVSACNLRTEIGKMYGTYLMENLYNKKNFTVAIPEFKLLAPFKMN